MIKERIWVKKLPVKMWYLVECKTPRTQVIRQHARDLSCGGATAFAYIAWHAESFLHQQGSIKLSISYHISHWDLWSFERWWNPVSFGPIDLIYSNCIRLFNFARNFVFEKTVNHKKTIHHRININKCWINNYHRSFLTRK